MSVSLLQDWEGFQRRYERKYIRLFTKALQEQVQQFKQGGVMAVNSLPIYTTLTQLYRDIGPKWAHRTVLDLMRNMAKARLPMGFSERIVELMRTYYGIDLLNDAELMTAYSREIITNVLSEAAQSGLSFDEIVRVLVKHPEFTKIRARRIARTETVTAANGAAIINAKESGLQLNKKWLAVNDKRTRPHHRFANGQTVGIDDPFNVNGTEMMQPGIRTQPNGQRVPASEVVNCRCVLQFIPLRDSRGRLL